MTVLFIVFSLSLVFLLLMLIAALQYVLEGMFPGYKAWINKQINL